MTRSEIDVEITVLKAKIDALRQGIQEMQHDLVLANGALQAFEYVREHVADADLEGKAEGRD